MGVQAPPLWVRRGRAGLGPGRRSGGRCERRRGRDAPANAAGLADRGIGSPKRSSSAVCIPGAMRRSTSRRTFRVSVAESRRLGVTVALAVLQRSERMRWRSGELSGLPVKVSMPALISIIAVLGPRHRADHDTVTATGHPRCFGLDERKHRVEVQRHRPPPRSTPRRRRRHDPAGSRYRHDGRRATTSLPSLPL